MKLRWIAPVAGAGALALYLLGGGAPTASPRVPTAAPRPPAVVLLEGPADGPETDVVVRAPGTGAPPRRLGTVAHEAGSARRAAVYARSGRTMALVVAQERDGVRRGSTYNSALFRVEGGATTRLAGGLTDASAPLVTESGLVLVQRGRDGEDPALDPQNRALRERVDALALDVVDPDTGAARTAWAGEGQIAFLAAPLRGDEVLVYHVATEGAYLLVLDAARGSSRRVMGPMPALARDFSYHRASDEAVFVRAAAMGSEDYEVVAVRVHDAQPSARVLYRGASDHLMPRALADGLVALSPPGDPGLALIDRAAGSASASASSSRGALRSVAPLGAGADGALGESPDGRWLAVRHTTRDREVVGLVERASGRAVELGDPARLTEFVAFAPAGVSP